MAKRLPRKSSTGTSPKNDNALVITFLQASKLPTTDLELINSFNTTFKQYLVKLTKAAVWFQVSLLNAVDNGHKAAPWAYFALIELLLNWLETDNIIIKLDNEIRALRWSMLATMVLAGNNATGVSHADSSMIKRTSVQRSFTVHRSLLGNS